MLMPDFVRQPPFLTWSRLEDHLTVYGLRSTRYTSEQSSGVVEPAIKWVEMRDFGTLRAGSSHHHYS